MRNYELDLYLSMGYFRMQQDVFTCQFVRFENTLCPVHWLRVDLANVQYGTKQLRLLRSNEKFGVTVRPFVLTQELKTLYKIYRDSINFDAPETIEDCLFGEATYNIFDTYMVEIRDGSQLIAAGVFDNGVESIAGIMNFYHPEYSKYSLGKYLILQKIDYARRQKKVYYYPGYIASNYAKFDYKLFACESATEVFDAREGEWLTFSWETVSSLAAEIMGEQ